MVHSDAFSHIILWLRSVFHPQDMDLKKKGWERAELNMVFGHQKGPGLRDTKS